MELFYPSLLVFLLALIVTYYLLPRLTPLVMTILAGILLVIGVHHHYTLFKSDYINSTWQDSLKLYAPAIAICALIIFIISFIFNFFTYGSVPVPSLPEIPNVSSVVGQQTTNAVASVAAPVTAAVSNVTQSIGNTVTNISNSVSETVKNVRNNIVGNNRSIVGGGVKKRSY